MSDSLLKLVNPAVSVEFMGQKYDVKKATLEQVVQYQQRVKQINEEAKGGEDGQVVSYAIFLLLKDAVDGLTEEQVSQNVPGDVDAMEVLTTLGFMNPAKIQSTLKMLLEIAQKENTTTPPSSVSSPTEQDGPQAP